MGPQKGGGPGGRPRLLVGALVAALLASNLWWVNLILEAGATQTETDASLAENAEVLEQTLAALLAASQPGATPEKILRAARPPGADPDGKLEFDRDGFVWVGRLGLRFDEKGRLVAARKAWK